MIFWLKVYDTVDNLIHSCLDKVTHYFSVEKKDMFIILYLF